MVHILLYTTKKEAAVSAWPDKDPEIAKKIKDAITKGKYRFTAHALEQMKARKVITNEVSYVLKNGYLETSKDSYDEVSQNWKYAMRGHTVDGRDLRVIVAMKLNIIVITVIDKDN
jgi:hypothetical protein